MQKTDENIYIAVHLRGTNIHYVKTTEEFITTIYDKLLDEGYTIRKEADHVWESNINNGVSHEVTTEGQLRNVISSILKI